MDNAKQLVLSISALHGEEPQEQGSHRLLCSLQIFFSKPRGLFQKPFSKGKGPSETNHRCGRQVEDEHPTFVWKKEAGPHEERKCKLGKTESDWECLETSVSHLWFSFLSLCKATNAQ